MRKKIDIKAMKKKLGTIARFPRTEREKLGNQLAFFAQSVIKSRTAQGVDYRGRPFEPYTPRYAYFRVKTGHPAHPVNLFYTGSMMSAMTHSVEGETIRIFFHNTKDPSGASNPAKAYFLNKNRKFFKLSEDDKNQMTNMVSECLAEVIRR